MCTRLLQMLFERPLFTDMFRGPPMDFAQLSIAVSWERREIKSKSIRKSAGSGSGRGTRWEDSEACSCNRSPRQALER